MVLSDIAIRRPVFTAMMSLCLVVLGVMGLTRLGTDLYPDVSFPIVTITTVYPGAGPSEVEAQIIKPIEDAVAGLSRIDRTHSFANESVGTVLVGFELSTSLDTAVQEVREKVAAIADKLPRDARSPVIGRVDIGATPILTYAVAADMEARQLSPLLDERLKPALAQIGGMYLGSKF